MKWQTLLIIARKESTCFVATVASIVFVHVWQLEFLLISYLLSTLIIFRLWKINGIAFQRSDWAVHRWICNNSNVTCSAHTIILYSFKQYFTSSFFVYVEFKRVNFHTDNLCYRSLSPDCCSVFEAHQVIRRGNKSFTDRMASGHEKETCIRSKSMKITKVLQC